MMNDKMLEDYFKAYKAATEPMPSPQLMTNILARVDIEPSGWEQIIRNPWIVFDMMMPKAIGWALTCCLGVYLGFSSTEQIGGAIEDNYYTYDQTQVFLFEELNVEETE